MTAKPLTTGQLTTLSAKILGAKGGRAGTEAQNEARRLNGAKGGRPKGSKNKPRTPRP